MPLVMEQGREEVGGPNMGCSVTGSRQNLKNRECRDKETDQLSVAERGFAVTGSHLQVVGPWQGTYPPGSPGGLLRRMWKIKYNLLSKRVAGRIK